MQDTRLRYAIKFVADMDKAVKFQLRINHQVIYYR